jgi:MFS family permease
MNKSDRKIFGTLFFSIFAAVTGVGIVVPLLPVYAHDLGASGFYIACIFGAFSLSRTIFLPYFGRLSDKKGRKMLIVIGLLFYAIISIAFLYAKSIETLIGIRLLQGVASAMILPVTQAYVGDITPSGQEGWVMGLFNMSVFLGLSIGPLMGGIINDIFSLNAAFWCMGIMAVAGFFASVVFLPPLKSEKIIVHTRGLTAWTVLLGDRDIIGLFIFRFSYATCIGIIWGFLPVYADNMLSLSSSSIGFLVMLGVAVSGLLQVPMGYLADRINKTAMVVSGGLISVCAFVVYVYASGYGDLFLANLLFGIGGGVSMPSLMALILIKGEKKEAIGTVMGIITMAHSFGMVIGAFIAGIMMDFYKLNGSFLLGAVIMMFGVVFFLFCSYKRSDSGPGKNVSLK